MGPLAKPARVKAGDTVAIARLRSERSGDGRTGLSAPVGDEVFGFVLHANRMVRDGSWAELSLSQLLDIPWRSRCPLGWLTRHGRARAPRLPQAVGAGRSSRSTGGVSSAVIWLFFHFPILSCVVANSGLTRDQGPRPQAPGVPTPREGEVVVRWPYVEHLTSRHYKQALAAVTARAPGQLRLG